ncbi:MAG: hypothetical protein GY711_28385, partial [bacterium]|nr:hypothetical protein [bacterium]MCP3919475.1 hypothetical protein [bacterium]
YQFDAGGVSQEIINGGPNTYQTDGSVAGIPAIMSGDTNYFQGWYRDIAGFDSNFTNSLGVTFF